MVNLEVIYAGLKLRNPFIVSSSGLTNTVEKCIALNKAGAGAIVLKSLFEEQLDIMSTQYLKTSDYPEAEDYIKQYVQAERLEEYKTLVKQASEACDIPIIASVNCYRNGQWTKFARAIQDAGASALELNVSLLDTSKEGMNVTQAHVDIVRNVVKELSIPVIVKIGENHDNLVHLVESLKGAGAKAVVLFNKYYPVDINIDTLQMTVGNIFSRKGDLSHMLRWVGVISGKTSNIDISASTGVLEWEDVVKVILSGATTVQLCTTVYENGNDVIHQMETCLEAWMDKQGFDSLAEFRGKLNYRDIEDQSFYERTQFMKYFTNRDSK